ncbi:MULTISPECIES: beta-ketoacyl-ACP synthase [unclassified Agarivorans]|uniref:beta-ketoacyl-ACP synthase n=1 Tax=unclassified Agarivorans TaxID=2636026 RepID=UPI0026E1BEBA|nr:MULTISPECIES: beta-ketoacyl-ACP synthase [unclassified Agarivorans]MDO6685284.1 beta-ketoacyl-ACP synthase [Agarivorans sp. 3_MG-2023]MDO6715544.1 beta-ketoacyl-ACP synthase [Agarivorans sp. 2_MG-2023]
MSPRVVVTGMAGLTAFGDNWSDIQSKLKQGENAVRYMPEWERFTDMHTKLAAPIDDYELPTYPRKKIRSMGRVSLLATRATELALSQAGLLDDPLITDGRMGVSYGSSIGSTAPIMHFGDMLKNGNSKKITSTTYIQMMSHTTPVNLGVFFGLKGRVITSSSACTSGSQGIGYAYEAIKSGAQQLMIAGGAEELCPSEAVVFDTLFATSTQNQKPKSAPRPFEENRDGLVIGEGAGTLILESLEHAQARGAVIYAELVGFGTNSDGTHVTQPQSSTMQVAMEMALNDAGVTGEQIGYVSAHGTATDKGDVAESHATYQALKRAVPISSIKSYLGHTLGACGALEAWFSIEMMNSGWFAPTLNLDDVDPECAALDYIVGSGRDIKTDLVMSNNFAFGGINTSLIFKRWTR